MWSSAEHTQNVSECSTWVLNAADKRDLYRCHQCGPIFIVQRERQTHHVEAITTLFDHTRKRHTTAVRHWLSIERHTPPSSDQRSAAHSIVVMHSTRITDIRVCYFAPGRGAKYCNQYVCLSVCSRNRKTAWPNLIKFSACCPWPWIGSSPTALRYLMYFWFCR